MKNLCKLLIILLLNSCSVEKTYYETGEIKSKIYSKHKREKIKTYFDTGSLFSIKKIKRNNLKRILSNGKLVNEQLINTNLKCFYNTGSRKKKFTYTEIKTFQGFVYQFELFEYNKASKLMRKIIFNNYNEESEFIVKSGKEINIEFSQDTILNYINKINSNIPNN